MEVLEENNHCCVGCLNTCTEDGYNLQHYAIKCEPLKAIFQTDTMCLCYVCRRTAQNAETFIQNVQSNQIFLQSCHNDLSLSTLKEISSKAQPSPILSKVSLHIIEMTETEVEDSVTIFSSKDSIKDYEGCIKLELKEEGSELLQEEFIEGCDDFSEHYVKKEEEDDSPISSLLKEDIDMDTIDLKTLRRTFKKKDKHNAKQIKLSDMQCKKERDKMARATKYLNSPYKCKDCIKGYLLKECYLRHMEAHDPSRGKYNCKICKQRFNTAKVLLDHKKRHLIRYKCTECDYVRASRPSVQAHFLSTHGFDQTTEHCCQHCKKSFSSKRYLRKHQSYAHAPRERVSCAHCQKTYVTKESLRAHIIRKHEIDGELKLKRYRCEVCGDSFGAPSQLKYHSFKHSLAKDFYCVECDKSFKTSYVLKQHLKTAASHVTNIELPLPCEYCNKRFANKRDLERHTNRIHLHIKPFPCDRCDKAYLDTWSLREHQTYSHDGGKRPLRYPCSVCEKVFDRNSILKSHMRTHTGERPYQCSRCSAQFGQASALGTHVKLIHLKLTRDGRPKPTTLK